MLFSLFYIVILAYMMPIVYIFIEYARL